MLNKDFNEVGISNDTLLGVAVEHECEVSFCFIIFLLRLDVLGNYLVLEAVVVTAFAFRAMSPTFAFSFAWNIVLTAASEEG